MLYFYFYFYKIEQITNIGRYKYYKYKFTISHFQPRLWSRLVFLFNRTWKCATVNDITGYYVGSCALIYI